MVAAKDKIQTTVSSLYAHFSKLLDRSEWDYFYTTTYVNGVATGTTKFTR